MYSVGLKNIPIAVWHFLRYPSDIIKLLLNKGLCVCKGNYFKKLIKISLYHKEYSNVFSRETVMNSIYICQQSRYYTEHFPTEEERLKEAERLVRQYAKAKMVITSRIHCALPCLGLETPVVFLKKTNAMEAGSCRFGGLEDLFNVINVENKGLIATFDFSRGTIPTNKTLWKNLANNLDKLCSSFIADR